MKEFGGASLGSAGMPLPALGSNETKLVEITVGTAPSLATAIPGQHQLTVNMNPVLEGEQPTFTKPASPYQVPVSLPPGYCQAKLGGPGAGGAKAAPQPGPPPMPTRPSAPPPLRR